MVNSGRERTMKWKALICLPLSLILALIIYLTWNMGYTLRYSGKVPVAERIPMILDVNVAAAAVLAVACYVGLLVAVRFGRRALGFACRYRYVIGLIVFVLCILFEISGSSISMYGDYLGLDVNSRGLLFGTGRGIRTWLCPSMQMISDILRTLYEGLLQMHLLCMDSRLLIWLLYSDHFIGDICSLILQKDCRFSGVED